MTQHRNAIIAAIVVGLIILSGIIFYVSTSMLQQPRLPTYFQYSENELARLKKLTPQGKMSVNELQNWDVITLDLIRKNALVELQSSKILAYLYTAQRDAAYLSHNLHGDFAGSLNPLSKNLLCIFFPKDCHELYSPKEMDPYSQELANIVIKKVLQRIQADQQGIHVYTVGDAPELWHGQQPYYGADVGSWRTWVLKSPNQFRAPPPSSQDPKEMQNQVDQIKTALSQSTDAQKKAVVFWAGGPGTITPPGQWVSLANDYMWSHDVGFAKALQVRSTLAQAIADAVIAVFDSKYTYLVKRPFMMDPSIKSIMPTPNHPSYPAAHSSISFAAATVLSHYFPDEQQKWQSIAKEAGLSRIWGGIHFNQDDIAGAILGEKVGQYAIQSQTAR